MHTIVIISNYYIERNCERNRPELFMQSTSMRNSFFYFGIDMVAQFVLAMRYMIMTWRSVIHESIKRCISRRLVLIDMINQLGLAPAAGGFAAAAPPPAAGAPPLDPPLKTLPTCCMSGPRGVALSAGLLASRVELSR